MQWSEMTTPERVAALSTLISENPAASASDLGEALSAPKDAVLGFINRKRDQLPDWAGRPNREWTPEQIEALKRGWADGKSYPEMAALTGSSTGSVWRKVQAMNLPPRSTDAVKQSFRNKTPKPTAEQRRFIFGTGVSTAPTLPKDVDETKFRPLPGSTPKLLHELGPRECHWPVALDGPALFCACHAESGRYCETHTKTSGKLVPRLVFK